MAAMSVLAFVLLWTAGHLSVDVTVDAHDAMPGVVVYRINAGGPAVTSTPDWSVDSSTAPSPHVNAAATGNKVYAISTPVGLTHTSIPAGTPGSIFQDERYAIAGGPSMEWNLPVTPGTYEVRLYFAELYFTSVGARVFNVAVEGATVLQNYDTVADVGPKQGVMKSFVVTADGNLDIDLIRVKENPRINAIEIIDVGGTPGTLAATPSSLAFGSVVVGQTNSLTVQLTNAGAAGSPDIVVDATNITGTAATQFTDGFDDSANVTLAPGQSTTVAVSFAPSSTGSKNATLEVVHSGSSSPVLIPLTGTGASALPGLWQSRPPSSVVRQEVAYVHLNGKFYLAGGSTAHERYDAATQTWTALAPLPIDVDHVQAVALDGRIYYIGGLISWPGPASADVYIYDPTTDSFMEGTPMTRPRGGGGVAVHGGKIYYVGGLSAGQAVPWLDVFDPATQTWSALPDMPGPRDHFHAAVVGNRLYVTGGRNTAINATITSTIAFDFVTGAWQTSGLAPLPTARGGFGAAVVGTEILIIGGEGGGQTFGHVEAYDTSTNTWRSLAPMPTPRHGIQAAVCNGGIYIAAGGKLQGGSQPSNVHEVLFPAGAATTCTSTNPPPPPPSRYHINAGGPALAGTPSWAGDTAAAPSPYVNASATGNKVFTTTAAVNTTHPSIPAGTPPAVFQSERYVVKGGPTMAWDFPVSPGAYEVRLYFAELYFTTVGARVFNVAIEGTPVLQNYDTVADVGPKTGVVKSFFVTADANLDIDLSRVKENPRINAIEIIAVEGGGDPGTPDLAASPSGLAFGSAVVGQQKSLSLQLTNAGASGSGNIVVDRTSLSGTSATQFADSFNDATDVTLTPGQSTTVTVTFAPTSTGTKNATLEVVHSGSNSPVLIPLTGTGAATPATSYRVNAGGAALSTTPSWSGDTVAAPSPYVNASATGNKVFSTTAAVNTTDPSIPAGTPASMFQSERYVVTGGPTMEWNFPVSPGTYEVRLYFAELYFTSVGARVFNVAIEGTTVLQNHDTVADVGPKNGVMKSFVVSADDNLDIDLSRVKENPRINGIEILPVTSQPGTLVATPSSVSFGTVLVGQSKSVPVQLTNAGTASSPSIVVDSTNVTGTAAADFSDSFNDASNVTLAPGQSTTVTVTFTPSSASTRSAQLTVVHSGTNTPLQVSLGGTGTLTSTIGFAKSTLTGTTGLSHPTSLQFGPDGRLYVGQQNGLVRVFTVARNGANAYAVTAAETISLIQSVPNHDDNGVRNTSVTTRLITGLLVVGTASQPVVYVTHSDPRIGAGPSGTDLNLDTNSSMISRLTRSGSTWQKLDLVRGLPRSEENHAVNGMQFDAARNVLYVAMGGHTNKGAPSNNFALLPEFALSAAVLAVDLSAIGETTYDLPTLDDETRPGTADANDPFGGNNGLNQARVVTGGPVTIHAPGFRNPYDLVISQAGLLYTIDNGPNAGWGDIPVGEGPDGLCTNAPREPGTTSPDSLHLITGPGYYGGHPNPTRGNTANNFNASNPQSPVPFANPVECDYRAPGAANGALATFPASTNGLTEYTTNNFGGALNGDLLAAAWNNTIYRIDLNAAGTQVSQVTALFSSVGSQPLDIQALGPTSAFPGTIWVGDYATNGIIVFEPNDYTGGGSSCTGANDPALDEDGDGFDNRDELDNATSPCSSADVPPDYDRDFTSDRNDPDDDNDGVNDESDAFARDASNGTTTSLPVLYTWENDAPSPGGLLNLGFTGLMTNGSTNYLAQFDPERMTGGGAAGVLTVDQVPEGDALGSLNTQQYGFQFGVLARPASTEVFTARTRIVGPFTGLTPQSAQSMGLFIGTGDQDNYAKVVVAARTDGTGIQFMTEVAGTTTSDSFAPVPLPGPEYVDLYLRVDPEASTVQAFYSVTEGGVTGAITPVDGTRDIPAGWLTNTLSGLAVGILSTSRGSAPVFPATWDFVEVVEAAAIPPLLVSPTPVQFEATQVGAQRTMTLTLTNGGSAPARNLVIDSTSITGVDAAQFSDGFNDATNVTLTPGASTSLTVTFAPTTPGTKDAVLSIAHSGSNSPMQVSLTGEAISAGPVLVATPSPVSFGELNVGQRRTLPVTLTHSGAAGSPDIVVDATSIAGTDAVHFADDFDDAGAVTLAAGTSTTVQITFAPSSAGNKSAVLSVTHSGGNAPLQVPLVGTANAVSATLTATPSALDFGNISVTLTRAFTLTLTNAGNTRLVVDATSITGTGATQFVDSFDDAGSVSLEPGESTSITVTFAPTTTGGKTATLSVVHSGSNSPLQVPLSGTGSNKKR